MFSPSPHKNTGLMFWCKALFFAHKKQVFIGSLLALSTALSGVALLMLSGWFITACAIAGVAILAGLMYRLDIYVPGSGIRFFALARTVSRYAERVYNHNAVLTIIAGIRLSLLNTLLNTAPHKVANTHDEEWLSKLTADLDSLDNLLLKLIIPPIVALFAILIVCGVCSIWLPDFGLSLGLLLGFSAAGTCVWMIGSTKQLNQQKASLLNIARKQVIEHIQGHSVLHCMNMSAAHQRQVLQTQTDLQNVQAQLNRKVANINWAYQSMLSVCLVMAALIALQAKDSGSISGPVVVLLIFAMIGLQDVLQGLGLQFSIFGQTQYAAKRLQDMYQQAPSTKRMPEPRQVENIRLSIKAHPFVPSSFDKDISIDISMPSNATKISMNQHEQHVSAHQANTSPTGNIHSSKHLILGRSGSGKSSIARWLMREQDIDLQGNEDSLFSLEINGQLASPFVSASAATAWHQQLAYLSQHNSVLADSLYNNLCLGLSNVPEHEIWQALSMVCLDEWVNTLPQGLHTWLGDTGNSLSGGQARRICLARLLLRKPTLVILDEPFNGLDPQMAAQIWQQIQAWLDNRACVLLMHEKPDFIDNSSVFVYSQLTLA